MTTKRTAGGHNDGVTRRATPTARARRTLTALLVPALVLSGALAGCGADSEKKPAAEPSVDLPTGNVDVPEDITLTKAGTALQFGEAATVAYEPNTRRSSVLSIVVDSVRTGRIADFSAYQLDERTKKSVPYYVHVRVKNVGAGDLSRSPIPLYAVDTRNTLIQPSSFNNTFKRCPSTPLPADFSPGMATSACLVYLVPPGGTLVQMSFRPLQNFEPITWKGTIEPAPKAKSKKSKKKKG